MNRLTFQANEVVELVMPASEAMLHCQCAGKAMLLMVTEHDFKDRVWTRIYWVSRTTGKRLAAGYTLSEVGIRVTDEGYEGQAPGEDDPSPETVQREAAELTARLMEILS